MRVGLGPPGAGLGLGLNDDSCLLRTTAAAYTLVPAPPGRHARPFVMLIPHASDNPCCCLHPSFLAEQCRLLGAPSNLCTTYLSMQKNAISQGHKFEEEEAGVRATSDGMASASAPTGKGDPVAFSLGSVQGAGREWSV